METILANIGPFGVQELLIILLVLVFLFGATRIPALGRALGEGVRNLRKGLKEPASDGEEASGRSASSPGAEHTS